MQLRVLEGGARGGAQAGQPQALKGTILAKQSFYDSLVFVTDGHDYLDHICFEYGLLECP